MAADPGWRIAGDMFHIPEDSRTRVHQFKVSVPLCSIDLRKRFFAVRVVPWWNSLACDTVSADSLDIFKRLLHRDLGDALFSFYD